MKRISTTALSKNLDLTSKQLFEKLLASGLVYRKNEKWYLSDKGKEQGGEMTFTEKYGEFITWPSNFNPLSSEPTSQDELLTPTKIGDQFHISNQRVNNILYELGWIEKAVKGWQSTDVGGKMGGLTVNLNSGSKMVIWSPTILENLFFLKAINPDKYLPKKEVKDNIVSVTEKSKTENKYPDTFLKTKDGHMVRSRAEMIIDNLLYEYGLTHAYERELTVAESVLSDFYIPARNGRSAIYIEFWGISDNEKYLERKKIKQDIYKNNNLNLIEIEDRHLDDLDSFLRKTLLKFNINVDNL